jgi:tetratricopeptide (TPR) repeat protein
LFEALHSEHSRTPFVRRKDIYLYFVESMALEAKNKGNAAFAQKDYQEALKYFTEAINLEPSNHVLYSNRSATYASLSQWEEALEDASKTVELKPDWVKVFFDSINHLI